MCLEELMHDVEVLGAIRVVCADWTVAFYDAEREPSQWRLWLGQGKAGQSPGRQE